MREWVINRLEMPPRTVLNRKIPKKAFFEQADLSLAEKELFIGKVEGIYLLSVMNQESINTPIYKDEEFYYAEIIWVYVELRTSKDFKKISSAVHKSIPNPVVLVLSSSEGKILLSTSHKKINKNNKAKIVIEQPIFTEWFIPFREDTEYSKLLNLLIATNLSFENLYEIYQDIHQWIRCEETIQLVGTLPTSKDKREEVIFILNNIQKQRKEIEYLKITQKGQLDFGAKMKLNIEIKKCEQQLDLNIQKVKELC